MRIFFIILLLILYIYSYYIIPTSIIIIQSKLDTFNFDSLYQRQPIIIEDRVVGIDNVLNSWFSENIKQEIDNIYIWNFNSHKYLYIYTMEDTEIIITNNKNNIDNDKSTDIIAIKLYSNQSLILPYRWYYNIKNNNNIKLYGLHDYITYLLDMVNYII